LELCIPFARRTPVIILNPMPFIQRGFPLSHGGKSINQRLDCKRANDIAVREFSRRLETPRDLKQVSNYGMICPQLLVC
jgi:hypothetical protein